MEVAFTVMPTGEVEEVMIEKSLDLNLDAAMIAIFEQMKWNPARYVLKNGVVYRDKAKSNQEDLVIYKDGSFFSNGKPIEHYTFKGDYYFVLNDYRDDVSDSRTFGLVKSELILGKYFMKFDFE